MLFSQGIVGPQHKNHKKKMSYCVILYVSWEFNETLRKIVFRHKEKRTAQSIDCFVTPD